VRDTVPRLQLVDRKTRAVGWLPVLLGEVVAFFTICSPCRPSPSAREATQGEKSRRVTEAAGVPKRGFSDRTSEEPSVVLNMFVQSCLKQ